MGKMKNVHPAETANILDWVGIENIKIPIDLWNENFEKISLENNEKFPDGVFNQN